MTVSDWCGNFLSDFKRWVLHRSRHVVINNVIGINYISTSDMIIAVRQVLTDRIEDTNIMRRQTSNIYFLPHLSARGIIVIWAIMAPRNVMQRRIPIVPIGIVPRCTADCSTYGSSWNEMRPMSLACMIASWFTLNQITNKLNFYVEVDQINLRIKFQSYQKKNVEHVVGCSTQCHSEDLSVEKYK